MTLEPSITFGSYNHSPSPSCRFPSTGGADVERGSEDIPFRNECSKYPDLCVLSSCGSLCLFPSTARRFLMWVESALIYGYSSMSLGVNLLWYSFSRRVVLGFPPVPRLIQSQVLDLFSSVRYWVPSHWLVLKFNKKNGWLFHNICATMVPVNLAGRSLL